MIPDVDVRSGRASRDHATMLDEQERGVLRHRRRALQHGEQRSIHGDGHGHPCDHVIPPCQGCGRSNSRFLRKLSERAAPQHDAGIVRKSERAEPRVVLLQHGLLE